MSTTPSADNVLLGSGALYFDLFDASGNKTGEQHFGNVTAFSIKTEDETKKMYESMTRARGLYKEVTTKRDVTCTVSGTEFNIENVSLNLMGTEGSIVQASGNLADVTLTTAAKKGRYYSTGKRNISTVVVKGGATTYEAGADYTVDAKTGRIYIVPAGAIDNDTSLTVSCAYAAVTLKTVEGGNAGTIEAALRFVGDPTAGPAVEVEVYRVKVNPNSEMGFISDDFGNWSLNCSVLADQSKPAGKSQYYRVIYL